MILRRATKYSKISYYWEFKAFSNLLLILSFLSLLKTFRTNPIWFYLRLFQKEKKVISNYPTVNRRNNLIDFIKSLVRLSGICPDCETSRLNFRQRRFSPYFLPYSLYIYCADFLCFLLPPSLKKNIIL